MNKQNFRKYAAISAVALGIAYAGAAYAAAVQIGTAVPVTVDVQVENSIDVVVTQNIDFKKVGAISDTTDVATMVMSTTGTITEDPGTGYGGADPAALVADPTDTPEPGIITVSSAFQNTELYVTYQTVVDPINSGRSFNIAQITDDLATPSVYDGTTDTMTTIGHETTDGSGGLVFNIGMTIETDTTGATAYADGVYAGSFEIVFSY